MSGTEICAGFSSFFGRIGSFTADGNGHITGGVEDVNTCTGVQTLQFTSSAYSIQADGRGTLTLRNSTGTTNYSITLSSGAQGYIVQTDAASTAGGSFQKQDTTAFSVTRIAGGYVFDFSGVSANILPESIIGRFTADGGGGISNGQFDDNKGGTPSGPFSFTGSYLLDATFGPDGRAPPTSPARTSSSTSSTLPACNSSAPVQISLRPLSARRSLSRTSRSTPPRSMAALLF